MPPIELGPIDGVGVLGGATAFPEQSFSNLQVLRGLPPDAWGARPDRSDEELEFLAVSMEQTLGVRQRAWAHRVGQPLDHSHEQTSLDLAIAAARGALSNAGVTGQDLSLILCATSTPHRMTATLSAGLGAALGASAAAMDIRTGCSAGLFALGTAALFCKAAGGPVLVVGAETFSKIIPPHYKMASLAMGDGAGALVVGDKNGAALLSAFLQTDGNLGQLVTTDGAMPPTPEEIARGGYLLTGDAEGLSQVVPGKYAVAIERALARAKLSASQIDLYVPHQTSGPLIQQVCAQAGIPSARAFVNLGRHANIGAAGWIAALVEAVAEGRCKSGDRVLLASVGGGMSWAGAVLRW